MASTTINNWIIVNPSSGDGNNNSVSVSAAAWTGRVKRADSFFWVKTTTGSGATQATKKIAVTQEAKDAFINVSETSKTFSKAGETITLSGRTNTAKITAAISGTGGFTIVSGSLKYKKTSDSTWTAVPSGGTLATDIGAEAEYDWQIQVNIGKNSTVNEKTGTLTLTATDTTPSSTTKTATCSLKQSIGDATLSIKQGSTEISSITIPAAGTAQTVTITANTGWGVSAS